MSTRSSCLVWATQATVSSVPQTDSTRVATSGDPLTNPTTDYCPDHEALLPRDNEGRGCLVASRQEALRVERLAE
jgi:hypothetical protein